jgi:hypothetical protein
LEVVSVPYSKDIYYMSVFEPKITSEKWNSGVEENVKEAKQSRGGKKWKYLGQ